MAQQDAPASILVLSPEAEAQQRLRQQCDRPLAQARTPAEAVRIMQTQRPEWIVQTPDTLAWLPGETQRDPLTGLLNRQSFLQRARQILQKGEPEATLIVFSLDRFRRTNETYGPEKGDAVLQALAQRLQSILRNGDLCARIGGDHFALLIRHFRSPQDPAIIAQRFFTDLSQPLEVEGRLHHLSLSMGVSTWLDPSQPVDQLFNAADAARKQASRQGGHQFVFFQETFVADTSRRMQLENHLRYALDRDEIEVWYQPQMAADTGELAGAEALIRWRHPELGMISPAEFVPIAEETGLIQNISLFTLDRVLADAATLHGAGCTLHFGVNLSPRQFLYDDLLQQIAERIENSPAPADWIEFEITESQAMTHLEEALDTMRALKTLGARLALDDFGTGYSSLSWLAQFPIDTLKIDQSFVNRLEEDEQMRMLIRAISALGHSLGHRLIAEGVETPAQRDFLKEIGVEVLQGFLFGQAQPASVFIDRYLKGK